MHVLHSAGAAAADGKLAAVPGSASAKWGAHQPSTNCARSPWRAAVECTSVCQSQVGTLAPCNVVSHTMQQQPLPTYHVFDAENANHRMAVHLQQAASQDDQAV